MALTHFTGPIRTESDGGVHFVVPFGDGENGTTTALTYINIVPLNPDYDFIVTKVRASGSAISGNSQVTVNDAVASGDSLLNTTYGTLSGTSNYAKTFTLRSDPRVQAGDGIYLRVANDSNDAFTGLSFLIEGYYTTATS